MAKKFEVGDRCLYAGQLGTVTAVGPVPGGYSVKFDSGAEDQVPELVLEHPPAGKSSHEAKPKTP